MISVSRSFCFPKTQVFVASNFYYSCFHNSTGTRQLFSISQFIRSVHLPVGVSLDLSANDQPSGVMEAQWGRRSSTGLRNCVPWGPHITNGLKRVSPRAKQTQLKMSQIHPSRTVTQYSITSARKAQYNWDSIEDTNRLQWYRIYKAHCDQKTKFTKMLNTIRAKRNVCKQQG